MPRKPTGKVTKSRAEVPQKNGDIYIYEREYQYDPQIKKTKRISNKLVAKIPKGTDGETPTRPKRKPADSLLVEDRCGGGESTAFPIHASRQRTGLINPVKKEDEDSRLCAQIDELKRMLEEGVPINSLTDTAQKKVAKYLVVRKTKGGRVLSVSYHEGAYKEACKCYGYFALISNSEKDRFNALEKYRKREKVEEYFQMAKEDADAYRPRVWYADHLMGRLIVQFVALGYEDCLRFKIGQMKVELGKKTGDPKHDTKEVLELENSLKKWLSSTSFSNVLRWFDAYETTEVSTTVANRRWNSETTKRDRLFFEKLGMQTS